MKKLLPLTVLIVGLASTAFANSFQTKSSTFTNINYIKGLCTITVVSGSFSYSWTEYYYAVSASHCNQIMQDRLVELQEGAQEEMPNGGYLEL